MDHNRAIELLAKGIPVGNRLYHYTPSGDGTEFTISVHGLDGATAVDVYTIESVYDMLVSPEREIEWERLDGVKEEDVEHTGEGMYYTEALALLKQGVAVGNSRFTYTPVENGIEVHNSAGTLIVTLSSVDSVESQLMYQERTEEWMWMEEAGNEGNEGDGELVTHDCMECAYCAEHPTDCSKLVCAWDDGIEFPAEDAGIIGKCLGYKERKPTQESRPSEGVDMSIPDEAEDVNTAVKFDGGKSDFTLIPSYFMEALAERMGEGACKYGRHNYLNELTNEEFDQRILRALLRHAEALKEDIAAEDKESESPGLGGLHVTAVASCCLMLIHRMMAGNE